MLENTSLENNNGAQVNEQPGIEVCYAILIWRLGSSFFLCSNVLAVRGLKCNEITFLELLRIFSVTGYEHLNFNLFALHFRPCVEAGWH